jgi:hypothetical protein
MVVFLTMDPRLRGDDEPSVRLSKEWRKYGKRYSEKSFWTD